MVLPDQRSATRVHAAEGRLAFGYVPKRRRDEAPRSSTEEQDKLCQGEYEQTQGHAIVVAANDLAVGVRVRNEVVRLNVRPDEVALFAFGKSN